ncbi:MAG: branched chain amino acid aminotransferase, partial [Gammaproteobacteria bacterium]|nr:branched chain amino acid aminotransferase [Gammaproteobacteria bacterium]
LSGTAAMLAGVGELLRGDEVHKVNGGEIGDNTRRLRRMLADIQSGRSEDQFGWLTRID